MLPPSNKRKHKEIDKSEAQSQVSSKSKGNKSSGCPHCGQEFEVKEKGAAGKHAKVKCCHCNLVTASCDVIKHVKKRRCPGLK